MTQARVIFWVHHWLIVWTNTWGWKCADLDIVRFPLARHRPVHPGRKLQTKLKAPPASSPCPGRSTSAQLLRSSNRHDDFFLFYI